VNLVREALEEHGVEGEMIVIADGDEAIKFIQALDGQPGTECPDLVIIDLSLPKRAGSEVLECMRQSNRYRDIPAIILTSSDAEEDQASAMRLGATRYLRKPLHLEEFLALGAVFKGILDSATL